MYRVAELQATDAYVDRTMFRSFDVERCWDYVRGRLEVSKRTKNRPARLYVLYKDGTFMDEPEDVIRLRQWTYR